MPIVVEEDVQRAAILLPFCVKAFEPVTEVPEYFFPMLAGFALLGTLLMCLQSAFSEARSREPALFTFLITLSGISFLGISSTVLGLLSGLLLLKYKK